MNFIAIIIGLFAWIILFQLITFVWKYKKEIFDFLLSPIKALKKIKNKISEDEKNFEMFKKGILIIFILIALCLIYQFFFRYEYKIYKGNYNSAYVIKIDKLTGSITKRNIR